MKWSGRIPRAWQAAALDAVVDDWIAGDDAGVVCAVMGAGKSAVIAELCALAVAWGWCVVVTVPSQALVRQTAAVIAGRVGEAHVGAWYQHRREVRAVTVACVDSLGSLPVQAPDLWIADEAHGTEAPAVLEWAQVARPVRRLGMSATPYRADEREALRLWSHEVYRYDAGDAIRDGVLVPWRRHGIVGQGVDVDEACADWIAAQRGAPGIVSATSIDDAEAYAATLSDRGIPAMAVHSRMSRAAVDARIAALERGEVTALVHVALLVEGVDLPWLRWLCLRRRRASRVAFAQEVGRVLRSSAGKERAEIFDPWDLLGTFGLSEPAALGEAMRPERAERQEVERVPLVDALTGEVIDADTLRAPQRKRLQSGSQAAAWIQSAACALRTAGIVRPLDTRDRQWRTWRATDAQLGLLARWKKSMHWAASAPETREGAMRDVARAYRAVHSRGSSAQRGIVSDLLGVLHAYRQETRAQADEALARFGVVWDGDEAKEE